MSTLQIPPSELILNKDGSVYHLNLLPKHLAPTVITVGDPDRVDLVASYFDSIEYTVQKREFRTTIFPHICKLVSGIVLLIEKHSEPTCHFT